MSEQQDELVLLERVFLRIGSADSDEKLESLLSTFLCPVLLKLDSQKDGVRKKVMELLVHVNKRLQARSMIKLPICDLLVQYNNPNISSFIKNFTIIYIKMGYTRMENIKQGEMIQELVTSIKDKPEPHKNGLLALMVQALPHLKLPKVESEKRAIFCIESQPETVNFMLEYFLDTILLPYNYSNYLDKQKAQSPVDPNYTENPERSTSLSAGSKNFNGPPPSMSEWGLKRVTGTSPITSEQLEAMKLGVLELIGENIFKDEDIICHLVMGTADTRHIIQSTAERHLKRRTGSIDWNKPKIIQKLYLLFQGAVTTKGQASTVKPEHKRTPSSIQARLKIFPIFLRSREAANTFPSSVQVVFDCLYGANTNTRIKHMAIQFVHHLCLFCSDAKFKPLGSVLLNGMVKLIEEVKDDSKLRSLTYVAVGKIAKRLPHLITKDVSLLQKFFDAISHEETENRLALQEALSMMSEAFSQMEPSNKKLVEALIMQNIEKTEPQARMIAVQYAKVVFPSDHIPSKYVLLLACGDSKGDIYSEASRYFKQLASCLDEKKDDSTKRVYPPFVDMVKYINARAQERLKTNKKYTIGNNALAFNPMAYGEMLVYLRTCLAYDSGVTPALESTAAMKSQAPQIGIFVKKLLEESKDADNGPVGIYINIIRQILTAIGGGPAMYCLLEIVAVASGYIAETFLKHKQWIWSFVMSKQENMREFAPELYSLILTSGYTDKQLVSEMDTLLEVLDTKDLECQHGSILAMGHMLGNILRRKRDLKQDGMETDSSDDSKLQQAMTKVTVKLGKCLDNDNVMLSAGAIKAIGEIGRHGPLPLFNDAKGKNSISKKSIVDSLVKILKTSSVSNKKREVAALSLGCICVGEEEFPHRKALIDGLMEAAGAQQFELHFTIGDAIVMAALGVKSPARRNYWIEESTVFTSNDDLKDEVGNVVNELITKKSVSTNPHVKQAACIWLLSITKQCGSHSYVQQNIARLQETFMNLLSENDEITQDIASKGLGVIYDICDDTHKEQMVSNLVETLMTGKSKKQKVTGETEIFEKGSLGKTPEGANLSTYKELCSIANDLNQPDLIYKFMHLANHNAAWNTKKGAAFGFSTILQQAGDQLSPHLNKIIPKLYRYQYDPNPKINLAMTNIWNALVKETNKTVDKYLKQITLDLLGNLTSDLWRVRESSCLAMADLLRGRPIDDIVEELPQLWEILFRIRDDIKESVRKSADLCCKALSKACIKICDLNYGNVGEQAIGYVLPVLLKSGLQSPVKEVQAIALSVILKISKNCGKLIKPHIPLLVVALLESLSELEPQYLNYVALQVAGSKETQEKLDSARIAASKSSPMMEVINMCVQYMDEEVLTEVVPRLTDIIKRGVGLGTKAGCAHLIISLVVHCPQQLAPFAGKLLAALLSGLNDRNVSVKKSFASAIGHIAKISKDSSLEKLILRLHEWYMEKEEESVRQACGITLQAIAQKSPDTLKRHGARVFPLAFLAMHEDYKDKEDSCKEAWEEVWLEGTPGTEGGIRLYLGELVDITSQALQSSSWFMKAQGASAMGTMADKMGSNLKPPHLGSLLSALINGLAGRTWTGKEIVLESVCTVCLSCKDALSETREDQPSIDSTIEVLMKECKKENVKYKIKALDTTSAILEKYDIDRFSEMSALMYPILNKGGEDKEGDERIQTDLHQIVYLCLGKSWSSAVSTQVKHRQQLFEVLNSGLGKSTWKVDVAVLKSLSKFLSRLQLPESCESSTDREFISSVVHDMTPKLCTSLGNKKYSTVRSDTLELLQLLLRRMKDLNSMSVLQKEDVSKLKAALDEVYSTDNQPELQFKASELIKTLS